MAVDQTYHTRLASAIRGAQSREEWDASQRKVTCSLRCTGTQRNSCGDALSAEH